MTVSRFNTLALVSLSLSMLLASLSASIANVALPTFAQSFHVSFHEVQWVVISYLLAITTLIVSVGRLGDMLGHRRLLLCGLALFMVASVLCSAALTFGMLIAARVMQGLGAAVMMVLAMALASEAVPQTRIGTAMGALATTSAIGTALGPSLGGMLISAVGWRGIFCLIAILAIVTWVLIHRSLPAEHTGPKEQQTGFDHAGTLLLALTLAAYALAMTLGQGHFGVLNAALLMASLAGAGLFVFTEKRAASPLIELSMFRSPVLSTGFAVSALVTTVMMTTFVVGPFYLTQALGLDAAHVGFVMSVGPLVAAMAGFPAGRITDRFGAGRTTVLGLIGIGAGSFILSMVPTAYGIPGYAGSLAVISFGYAFFQPGNNTQVMGHVPQEKRGIISALLNLSRNLGLITGASVMGAIFAWSSGTSDMITARPEAVARGMHTTFACAGVLIMCALALASRLQIRTGKTLAELP